MEISLQESYVCISIIEDDPKFYEDEAIGADDGTHRYRSLESDEVRLLVLNSGQPNDPIECYLEHWIVHKAKSYTALSYVWGHEGGRVGIQVDGCAFAVTNNLYGFLKSYRHATQPSILWVDAICINQNDILERNSQIGLMKRLYEGAEFVLVWLGPEVPGTAQAFKVLSDV